LELELSRSLIFPELLDKAQKFFSSHQDKETYFATIQIPGKMKNGKLLSVSALICIKKTGNVAEEKKVEGKKAKKKKDNN
jgi:hypothetical protein